MTLQFALSCAMSRFDGCAGGEETGEGTGRGGRTEFVSRTLGSDRCRSAVVERFDKTPLSF